MKRKKTKNNEFQTLVSYIETLQSRYFHALCAFYAWERLQESVAPNIVGIKQAKENVQIVNKFRNFFLPSQEALKTFFFLEVAKIIDVSNQSLHINKIINFSESNLNQLTIDSFKSHNQDRKFKKELVERYKGLQYADLISVKAMLERQGDTIEKIKSYRDKWIAHHDIKKPKLPNISADEMKSLFKAIQQILNLISGKLNDETWMYHHVENDVKRDFDLIIDHLKRFEPYRLKEIQEKYEKTKI